MVVLGDARVRDLPGIPGRGIWQSGKTKVEVQTSILGVEEDNALLASHRKEKFSTNATQKVSQPVVVKER